MFVDRQISCVPRLVVLQLHVLMIPGAIHGTYYRHRRRRDRLLMDWRFKRTAENESHTLVNPCRDWGSAVLSVPHPKRRVSVNDHASCISTFQHCCELSGPMRPFPCIPGKVRACLVLERFFPDYAQKTPSTLRRPLFVNNNNSMSLE
jgi:hypothetical protein